MNRPYCLLLILITLGGCTVASTTARPESLYNNRLRQVALDMGEPVSLFPGDSAVLTDDAIRRILDYRYAPPALSRIGLMPSGMETWSGWSESLAVATDRLQTDVIDLLEASPHVYDAAYLPSVLIPERRSVPYLREAAARFQADLLLAYRSYCRSFRKYRMFRADQSRAFCGIEAVLIDTRTGLVPLTVVASRTFDVQESSDDLNFQETILKAQLAAVAGALSEAVSEVVQLLDTKQDAVEAD